MNYCAKCDYHWPWTSWEEVNCPKCGTDVTSFEVGRRCELCGGYVPCPKYSSGNCESCGVLYEYEEGRMLSPTPEQLKLWNAAPKLYWALKRLLETADMMGDLDVPREGEIGPREQARNALADVVEKRCA